MGTDGTLFILQKGELIPELIWQQKQKNQR